jgi:hypothetical protein
MDDVEEQIHHFAAVHGSFAVDRFLQKHQEMLIRSLILSIANQQRTLCVEYVATFGMLSIRHLF